ncbi:MAG: HAMP domain-containing sensor histidine kinase [Planctomycetota bacterium]|nr:HAMP domain-containing sensor histidine kinase [Planctomycetota bacterium]
MLTTTEAALANCVIEALPISSLPTLLGVLAKTWRAVTDAPVYVSAIDPSRSQVYGVLIEADESSEDFSEPSSSSEWRAGAAEQSLHGMLQVRQLPTISRTLAFDTCGTVLAGVCILGDCDPSPADDAVRLSSRLVAEWKQVSDFRRRLAGRTPNSAKLEAMAEFAAGAGHEINNPLATISGRVQLLLRGESNPERRGSLEAIGAQTLRIRDMIGDAMLFARPPLPNLTSVDLAEVVKDVTAALAERAQSQGCRLAVQAESPIPIVADPIQVRVVVSSLVSNSLEAHAGRITVTVENLTAENSEEAISADSRTGEDSGYRFALLRVFDTGQGMNAEELEHLFDPFYSGRQAGRGLGFGLAKCWRIVTMHGGRIAVEPTAEGTTFRVFWPSQI